MAFPSMDALAGLFFCARYSLGDTSYSFTTEGKNSMNDEQLNKPIQVCDGSSFANSPNTENVLSLRLGSMKIVGTIVGVRYEDALDKDGKLLPRVAIDVETHPAMVISVNEAWVRDRNGKLAVHGFWLKLDSDGKINSMTTLGKFLRFIKVEVLEDVIGKRIDLHPKRNGYVVAIATKDFNASELGWT